MRQVLPLLVLIFSFLGLPSAHSEEQVLAYSLDVSFDMPHAVIKGVAMIPVIKGQELKLHRGRLTLTHVTLDGEGVTPSEEGEWVSILPPRKGVLEIKYEGAFGGTPEDGRPSNFIGPGGIFLSGPWYPKPDHVCVYRLRVTLPTGYEAVSEAEKIEKTTNGTSTLFTFTFPHPVDGINLVATDRYGVTRDRFEDVEMFAYFFPEDRDLAKTFCEHAKRYLALYTRLIGPFPYKRFSIVENFLPTGYSMPTYTVFGQQIVRLPFIPQTSLGHEILHQWLGNLVFIDYEKGNWAEGLTTFLADHLYEEEKGSGWEYRKGVLSNYMSYVHDKNEFPLKDFVGRTDRSSQAIGYGKAVMVFQMLRNLVGRETFFESLRYFTREMGFKKASWTDIRRAFEKYYWDDLSWFFHQWIDRKGLPDLTLGKIDAKPSGSGFKVAFDVLQGKYPFVLDIPVAIYSKEGKTKKVFRLSAERDRFEMTLDKLPEKIVLDEDYDLARRLSLGEFPPVIARLLGDEKRILVLPPLRGDIYEEIINAFRVRGDGVRTPDRLTFNDLKSHSLVILGSRNPVIERLYGPVAVAGGLAVVVKNNPWDPWKVTALFDASSKEEVEKAFPKLFHYGDYSSLSFDRGVNTSKKTTPSDRGIVQPLLKEAIALDISSLKTLSGVMDLVANKKIIYVGEAHDHFPHHAMQLEIIKDLHGRGKKIAIGMEMFERRFQKVVDDYVEGKIGEGEFLKSTEYFKRWGFDYSLYRPILLFAKSAGIPVVALNQQKEIVHKVFRGGLDSLSDEEKKVLPEQMDFSDDIYRDRLKKIFLEHEPVQKRDFDLFYQAQILWDETMAESLSRFLKAHHPDGMVVLAGSGHLAHGSGIPSRTARRSGGTYAVILNDVEPESGAADFVLYPGPLPERASPKLMVVLKEDGGRVEIVGFPQDSASEKAGMKVSDLLLAIDQSPLESIDDLKIDLLSRQKGDNVKVRVLRKGFLGSREITLEVALQ